jgi:Bacterial Ig-like domain (group 3)/FG-GAP-like repeat
MPRFSRSVSLVRDIRSSRTRLSRTATAGMLAVLFAAGAHGVTPPFPPITTYPSGGAAQYTATADVNGDGKQDVFASNLNGVISVLLGNGNGSFKPPKTIVSLPKGSYPILTADFNRDGRPDLAILEPASARILIYLGKGDGSFESPKSFAAGSSPRYMAVGDVNGDHNPDLIVSASTTTSAGFSILLGQGNGNFHAPAMITAKNGAASGVLAVGDVNNDGHLDVVTTNQGGQSEVFLGNGNGTFREQNSFDDGTLVDGGGESQLLLADLYGKGKLDLVVASFGFEDQPTTLVWLQGNGDGTFSNPKTRVAGFDPSYVEAADMNGDGKVDLVVGNAFSNSVTVMLNRGSGNFTSTLNNYTTGYLLNDLFTPTPGLLSIADLNGDGKPDLVLASATGVNVLLNLGGGVLHAPASVEVGQFTNQVLATDFNRNGDLDLAVVTAGMSGYIYGDVNVLFGNGSGSFTGNVSALQQGDYPGIGAMALGYFDGNGTPDIAAYGWGKQGIYQSYSLSNGSFSEGPLLDLANPPAYLCAGDFNHDGYSDLAVLDGNEIDIYLNKHDGTYSGPVSYTVGLNPLYVLAGDLNKDGKLDLVTANHGSNDVSVLLGKGDGTFYAAKSYPAGDQPNVVTTGDFNRDGKVDLAVGGNKVSILRGIGNGTFSAPVSYAAKYPVTYLAQADLNGKGIGDLLAVSTEFGANTPTANLYLFPGKGDGTFSSPVIVGAGEAPYWLTVGDFNGDGAQDVVVSDTYSSALTLLLNQRGTLITLKSSAATVKAGQTITFTATVSASVPGSGGPTGTVTFNDGSKTIGTAQLGGGKATFATAHLGVGTHSVSASYAGNASFNLHVSAPAVVKVN